MEVSRRELIAIAAAVLGAPATAFGQDGRETRLVLPLGVGGPVDGMARSLADALTVLLKRPFIVDNKGGAAGQIAAGIVAKAVGDPNMLLLGSMGIMAVSPHLYPKLPYDVRKDFTPISLCARVPNALIINPTMIPVRTIQEFSVWAKAQKKEIPFASYGSGSISHIAAEMFKNATSLPMVQVPYRDPSRIQSDLVAGEIGLIFDAPSGYAGFAAQGRVRMLALTSRNRLAAFPDLPTLHESGYPGFDISNWYGIYMPSKVPAAAAAGLRQALKFAVESPRLQEQFAPMGFEITAGTEDFASYHLKEIHRWQEFVRQHQIRITT